MGATTRDIFGLAPAAESATPGTYGQQPSGYRLPQETRLGAVRLQVADLGRSIAFYEDTLGMRTVARDASRADLAAQGDSPVLVRLEERAGAKPSGQGLLGLYHFAILLPDRPSLARFAQHLADRGLPAGASDHRVSEAFYLSDPDGLGIEVYADRPRESWQREGRQLMISTDPIDMRGLLASAKGTTWTGMPTGTVIGHVHLHVGDIAQGSAFFSEALGFDRMTWRYPGALFLGAGGYHHHLGTNIWAGPGARPPAEDDARLLEWTIEVPARTDVDGAAESLTRAGHDVQAAQAGDVVVTDPWGTVIRIRALDGEASNHE